MGGKVMKRRYSIISLIVLSIGNAIYCMDQPAFMQSEIPTKKKILILTSLEYGNKEAGRAMATALQENYMVELIPVFKEILGSIDPLNYLTGKQYSSEQFYNEFVASKSFNFLELIFKFGKWIYQVRKDTVGTLLQDYFIKTKPDLIISVIPVINNIILEVAQKLDIPFLLFPTDLDVEPYIIKLTHPTYKKFYLGLIFNDPEIMVPIQNAHISQDYIRLIGAPLRPEFFIKKNKSDLKYYYGIDENKKVIMVLMGSQGCNEMEIYIAELIKIAQPFHLLACIGKNESCRANIEKLLRSAPHISGSVIGFTPDIADYMTMTDVFLTKSGTLSVCEALYKNLPLFLDATSTVLPWEQFNHRFIKKNNFGISITDYKQVVPIITQALEDENILRSYKSNIQKLEKKDFSQEFKKLIEEIIQK